MSSTSTSVPPQKGLLSTAFKQTLFLRTYAFFKIPLLFSIRPSVVESDHQKTIIRVKLRRYTKNHLGSMYFGAIAMGAELVVALKAVLLIYEMKKRIDFVFKDFQIDFQKRAEGDVYFSCEEGEQVEILVKKCLESGDRETGTFTGRAYCKNSQGQEEIVSQFKITLSVKYRKPSNS